MNRKAAKELLHIQSWLLRVDRIITRGKQEYVDDALLQEAGDSLMLKLGEAANRLSRELYVDATRADHSANSARVHSKR